MSSTNVRDDQLPRGAGSDNSEVPPVPAASTIVLRRNTFELLLMRRTEKSTFVPGAWVFPGGTVEEQDRVDDDELMTARRCAVRELFEESGILLSRVTPDPELLAEKRRALLNHSTSFAAIEKELPLQYEELVWTARWITPLGVPKRFDTWFFLAAVDDDTAAEADQIEGTELLWIRPQEALDRHRSGALSMVFPTLKNLEALLPFSSVDELLASRRIATIPTTRPILVVDGVTKKIVLPES